MGGKKVFKEKLQRRAQRGPTASIGGNARKGRVLPGEEPKKGPREKKTPESFRLDIKGKKRRTKKNPS